MTRFFSQLVVLLLAFSLQQSVASDLVNTVSLGELERGRAVYKGSNCAFCHGWAADGRGHPRSPGAAPNLRKSQLDKDALSYIIRCGVIGGAMPYHDRLAYRDNRCVTDPGSIDKSSLPAKGRNISAGKLEDLVVYLVEGVRGGDRVTLAECEAFFKPGSRNCQYLKK